MRYEYIIEDDLTLKVWDTENPNEFNAPFLAQPFNPEKAQPWQDRAEVEAWVLNEIEIWEGRKERPKPEEPIVEVTND